jgi:hypothetical protein
MNDRFFSLGSHSHQIQFMFCIDSVHGHSALITYSINLLYEEVNGNQRLEKLAYHWMVFTPGD